MAEARAAAVKSAATPAAPPTSQTKSAGAPPRARPPRSGSTRLDAPTPHIDRLVEARCLGVPTGEPGHERGGPGRDIDLLDVGDRGNPERLCAQALLSGQVDDEVAYRQ